MSKAVFRDFDLYDAQIAFENEKFEELCEEIEPQVEMIKNFANQIRFKIREYKRDYGLDFEEDVM